MSAIDTGSGQRFERRIGRRVDVDRLDVTFFIPESGRFRKKVPAHEVPARIENVSITGAAILASSSLPWGAGDRVVVRSRGADNLVIVRHRHDTPAGTRFGVELTRSAVTLKRQIREVLDPHLATVAPPSPPRGPILGLRRTPVGTSPVLPSAVPPAAEAPPAEPAAPAGPAAHTEPQHGPGPVLDLSGPEPVIDITDSVMGLAPRPSPATTVAPPTLAEPTTAEPTTASQTEAPERPAAPHAPAPRLPHSAGRQVLDDVFGLMDD
jgi:hypothetical protein